MFANRQTGDEFRERIEIEISSEDAVKLTGRVIDGQRAGNTGHPLPIEHIGRQPNEPAGSFRAQIEGSLPRVVSAIVVGSQYFPSAVLKRFVFHHSRLAVHNVAMVDVRSAFRRAVCASELSALITVAHPAKARIGLQNSEQLWCK